MVIKTILSDGTHSHMKCVPTFPAWINYLAGTFNCEPQTFIMHITAFCGSLGHLICECSISCMFLFFFTCDRTCSHLPVISGLSKWHNTRAFTATAKSLHLSVQMCRWGFAFSVSFLFPLAGLDQWRSRLTDCMDVEFLLDLFPYK